MHPLRLGGGILWGWSIALFFIVWVGLRLALNHQSLTADQRGVIGIAFLVYLTIGAAVGIVAGTLGSYLSGRKRAVLLGFLAAVVMYGGAVSVELSGRTHLLRDSILVLVMATVTGPLVGIWRYHRGDPDAWPVSDYWP